MFTFNRLRFSARFPMYCGFWCCFVLLVIISAKPLFAQKSRQQLEKEKRENLERMNEVRGILKQTTAQKRASLGQLKAIGQQISTQKRKIDLISEDLSLMNNELHELMVARMELDQDLAKLRKEYGTMIYASSKRNNSLSQLSFLFSAPTFNQFYIRYKYLKQYTKEREKQVSQMKQVQALMVSKTTSISTKKQDQQKALTVRITESKNLEQLKTEKDKVVKELSSRESELQQELAEIRKANREVENTLTNIIRREIKERREREAREKAARERVERERLAREREAKKQTEAEKATDKADDEVAKVAPKPEPKAEPTPDPGGMNETEMALASSFSASRGRLPWPVRSGFVSDHFGTKPHPTLPRIFEKNDGVDIQTNAGEAVRSVYDGVVMGVENMGIIRNVVYIQHGDYYTIYTKLKSVSVRTGQKVKARDPIGIVATDSDGVSEINFQIWKNTNKMNPEPWLAPR
jgi:murein hydrolase activator